MLGFKKYIEGREYTDGLTQEKKDTSLYFNPKKSK